MNTLSTCIEVACGKQVAMQFELQIEMGLNQYKWSKPWTKDMQRRFRIAYPDQLT